MFFQTVFGFSQSRASSLGNWCWAGLAGSPAGPGFVSDRIRVRKPFMLAGAMAAIFITTVSRCTPPSRHQLCDLRVLLSR